MHSRTPATLDLRFTARKPTMTLLTHDFASALEGAEAPSV
jgi:hypothetical protein